MAMLYMMCGLSVMLVCIRFLEMVQVNNQELTVESSPAQDISKFKVSVLIFGIFYMSLFS